MVVGGRDATEHDALAVQFGPNPYDPRTSDEARDLLLGLAFRQVGLSNPEPYWRRVGVWTRDGGLSRQPPFPPHWCGAFHLAQLHEAALTDWPWIIDPGAGHWGFYWRLPRTTSPKPGDGAYFTTNQHHAIYVGDGRLINGNGTGGEVTVTWLKSTPDAYYSIEPLVERFDELPGEVA